MSYKLLVATSKGLVVWKYEKTEWFVDKIHFRGLPVSLTYIDSRNQTWWASITHRHWGQKLHFSKDEGASWQAVRPPQYPKDAQLPSGKRATLRKIWIIEQGGADRPNELWLGTEPGGLFQSKDFGQTFQLIEGLWNHPSRADENQWFGAGKDDPFIHSIVVNPENSNHVYVAVSCAGVFETTNGGETWQPRNEGLVAAYLPNPNVEVGHDPHRMLMCHSNPKVLWQQNHCGIFRSTDGGQFWKQLSDKNQMPHYGFALAIDEKDSEKAWVIPAVSDEERVAFDLALCVCETNDGGKTWTALRDGLPQNHCFDIVFRHAFAKNNQLMAFGSTTGNLYLSEDEGNNWKCLSNNLARVESVVFTHKKRITRSDPHLYNRN
ncbi:MAG: glycosyl hydrolase [Bacteroidota bacterium]